MQQELSIYQKIKQQKLWAALAVIFWFFLFLTTVSKTYIYYIRNDVPIGFGYTLLQSFLIWGIAAMFMPLFIRIAQKKPIEGKHAYRNAGFHIAVSLLFVPVHTLFFEAVLFPGYRLLNVGGEELPWSFHAFVESYLNAIIWIGLVAAFSYWLVVGGYHLKKYYTQFKERQLKNAELKAKLSAIRLHVLKSQLHPHFLFNTLHNVHSLIQEDAGTAEKMLTLLKRFLQISVERVNEQQVPLQEEIEFTDIYLEIEQIRFGGRLTIEKNIDTNTQNASVPNLMLQPLVENSIRHGISKKMESGKIKVTSQKSGSVLRLSVEDNGPGINGKMNSTGVGLKNISQRLEYLYEDPTFKLSESSMGGLKVQIEIPLNVLQDS